MLAHSGKQRYFGGEATVAVSTDTVAATAVSRRLIASVGEIDSLVIACCNKSAESADSEGEIGPEPLTSTCREKASLTKSLVKSFSTSA